MSCIIRIDNIKSNEIDLYINNVYQNISNYPLNKNYNNLNFNKKRSDLIPLVNQTNNPNKNIQQLKITSNIQSPYSIGTIVKYNIECASEIISNQIYYLCTNSGDKYVIKTNTVETQTITFNLDTDIMEQSLQLYLEDLCEIHKVTQIK